MKSKSRARDRHVVLFTKVTWPRRSYRGRIEKLPECAVGHQSGSSRNCKYVSMKDRRMPFPTTYPLFQLVRLMSIREDGDSGKSPVVTKYAWIEAGEDNLLALYNSNGKYILTQFFVTLCNV